ncbi:hypothetical protein [Nocardia sp. BMG111209]|uniref:hypothetical protein n=1 Tax=Nocardia sp. BMG111209 TaxID=1160137 RepID=UPI0012DF9CBB|nr:hypothetical protein [Nocardia sp. BMG111209]
MPSRPDPTRRYRWWPGVVIATICLAAIVFFGLVSLTLDGRPAASPFDGWVAVLGSDQDPMDDHVELSVAPALPGAPGDHPQLTYAVAVCGDNPFHGILLLGGDARLADLRPTGPASADAAPPAVNTLPNPIVDDIQSGQRLTLGGTQQVDLDFPAVEPCVPSPSGAPMAGAPAQFTGTAGASIQRHWDLGWWSAPRQNQAWPRIGSLPGTSANDLGPFAGVDGLSGTWARPPATTFRVTAGPVAGTTFVEAAAPAATTPAGLGWELPNPFQPSARLTDTESQNRWQQLRVLAGVLLGLAVGVAALRLYGWLRGRRTVGTPAVELPVTPQPVWHRRSHDARPPVVMDEPRPPLELIAVSLVLISTAAIWFARSTRRRGR